MKPQEIQQANFICRKEWNISALAHNLLVLVLQKYKRMRTCDCPENIELFSSGDISPLVDIHFQELLSGVTVGGNQYEQARQVVKTLATAHIVFERYKKINGVEVIEYTDSVNIFSGQSRFIHETQQIECGVNPQLLKYWFELHEDYTRLPVDKVLQLPLNTTAHLLFQYLMSYKFQGQFQEDIETFKTEIGCKKMDMRDFTRRILARYQKEFTEQGILHWEYEFVKKGRKITKIRVVFPEEQKPQQADTAKKGKVKSENWGWIPLWVVKKAENLVKTEVWREALRNLAGIRDSVPPEERSPDHPELLRFIRQMEYAEQNTIKG